MTATKNPLRLFRDAAGRYATSGLGSADITALVRRAAVSGRYAAGDRLPDRASLAEEFEVSTPTIDRALEPLLTEGVIDARPGRYGGLFVKQVSAAEARAGDQMREEFTAMLDRTLDAAYVGGLGRDEIRDIVEGRLREFDRRLRSRRARVLSRIGGFRSGFTDVSVNHDAYLDR